MLGAWLQETKRLGSNPWLPSALKQVRIYISRWLDHGFLICVMLSLIRQPFVQGNRFQTYDSLPTFILFALLGAVDNTSNDGQLWNS